MLIADVLVLLQPSVDVMFILCYSSYKGQRSLPDRELARMAVLPPLGPMYTNCRSWIVIVGIRV